jgi:hypothetical protein
VGASCGGGRGSLTRGAGPAWQVDMTENPAGDDGVACFAPCLRRHWVQARLDLRAIGCGPAGLRSLAAQLSAPRVGGPGGAAAAVGRVVRVYLGGNRLGPGGGEHLARLLDAAVGLEEMDVSGCGLLDEGVRLARARSCITCKHARTDTHTHRSPTNGPTPKKPRRRGPH